MIVTELFARLGVQIERASFRQAEGAISGIGKALGSIGATLGGFFAAHQFGKFVEEITHMGAALHDQSDRLGVSTQALQELGLAAQLAGADSSSLETGLRLLGRNATNAVAGSKELAKAFRSHGISLKTASGETKTADMLLEDVADAMQQTTDPTKRTALAMQLLGRSGTQLIPLLKDGAKGLREARGEAHALGGGLSEDLIKTADEFDDNLTRLNFSLLSLKSIIGTPILSALDNLTRKFIAFSAQMRHWLETNKFFQYALKIGIVLLGAFAAAAAWTARATIASWAKAAAPFLVIVGAVVLLAAVLDDLHALFAGGKSLLGEYLDKWTGIGTADKAVRSWADGVKMLTEALKELFETGDPTKFVKNFAEALSGFGAAQKGVGDRAALRGKIEAAQEALAKARRDKDPVLAAIAERRLAELNAEDFGAGANSAISRASGRGIDAGAETGPKAGQASAGAVSAAREASAGFSSSFYTLPQPSVSAPVAGAPNVTVGGTSVTVQTQSNASARDIAREAEKAARRLNEQQAKDLERAMAPNATLRDFAQTLELE
jgi:hypothetical protein